MTRSAPSRRDTTLRLRFLGRGIREVSEPLPLSAPRPTGWSDLESDPAVDGSRRVPKVAVRLVLADACVLVLSIVEANGEESLGMRSLG